MHDLLIYAFIGFIALMLISPFSGTTGDFNLASLLRFIIGLIILIIIGRFIATYI